MGFKIKLLFTLGLSFSLFQMANVVEASEIGETNLDLQLTDYEESNTNEYDDSSYFIVNVRKALNSENLSKLSADYKLLKQVDTLWREGSEIDIDLLQEAEKIYIKYIYTENSKARSSGPSWEQWQATGSQETIETFYGSNLMRVTIEPQKRVTSYYYVSSYSGWGDTKLEESPSSGVQTRTIYTQIEYRRYEVVCKKKTFFITSTERNYYTTEKTSGGCSSGYTRSSGGWQYARTKDIGPSGTAWRYYRKITETYVEPSKRDLYKQSTQYRYAYRSPSYEYRDYPISSTVIAEAPKIRYSDDTNGVNFILFGQQGSVENNKGVKVADNIYGENNIKIAKRTPGGGIYTSEVFDTTNGQFYLGDFTMSDTESNEASVTYKAPDGSTYTSSSSFFLKYRNSIGYTNYTEMDGLCSEIELKSVLTDTSYSVKNHCINANGDNYVFGPDSITDMMYFYMKDKLNYLEYNGMKEGVLNDDRLELLLTSSEGTFHRNFTRMVREFGIAPDRSVHYFRNQLQDGIAPDTYDEFKKSSNYSNWNLMSESGSIYHQLEDGKVVQSDPNYEPGYNLKYVSSNGNFEVIYNPKIGIRTNYDSYVGGLVDMEYDCINMGTYNYVFSDAENELPSFIPPDLPQMLESYPHLKYDMLPYGKYLLGIFGQNYGNTWL